MVNEVQARRETLTCLLNCLAWSTGIYGDLNYKGAI